MSRNDYYRWRVWHRRIGYALLGLFLVIGIYLFTTAQWFGGVLTVPLIAFVLWTLHHGD